MTKSEIDASEAPLIEHLIELRTRLIWCVVGFILAFIVSFYSSISSRFWCNRSSGERAKTRS